MKNIAAFILRSSNGICSDSRPQRQHVMCDFVIHKCYRSILQLSVLVGSFLATNNSSTR